MRIPKKPFIVAVAICALTSVASATDYNFDAYSGWKSNNLDSGLSSGCPGNVGDNGPSWTGLGFDDSGWRDAYTGWVQFGWIWDWPNSGSPVPNNGTLGPDAALFRLSFELDGIPVAASYSFGIDDDIMLYVNGVLRDQDLDGGGTNISGSGVEDWFRPGLNTVAAYVWNNNTAGRCVPQSSSVAGRKALAIYGIQIETEPSPVIVCEGFQPPLGDEAIQVRKNRTIPIKAVFYDEFGIEVTDTDILSPPVIEVTRISSEAFSAEEVDVPGAPWFDGNEMRYSDEIWIHNLRTKSYRATGTYSIEVKSGDEYEYRIDPTCVGQFIIP